MSHHICLNPDCKKSYEVKENETDDGYCSYQCWEKTNCIMPPEVLVGEDVLVID